MRWLFIIVAGLQFTAKRMEIQYTPEGRATVLEGGVEIMGGSSLITAQSARFYHAQELLVSTGEVRIRRPDLEIRADSGVHLLQEQRSHLWGEILIEQEGTLVYAKELRIDHKEEMAYIPGGVRIMDRDGELQLTGGFSSYNLKERWARVELDPLLEKGGVRVTARRMELRDRPRVGWAIGEAELSSGDAVLSCDTIVYRFDDHQGVALGSPVLRDTSGWIEGDSINFFIGEHLDSLWVVGNCAGEYRTQGGERIVVAGEAMELRFKEGRLERLSIKKPREGRIYLTTER